MKVHLPTYAHGLHRIEEAVDPSDLDLDPQVFCAPISARLSLDRHDQFLQFHFWLDATVKLCCDRCLVDFDDTIVAEGPMLYILGKGPRGEEVDDPEIAYIANGTVELDISTDLRDLIMSARPASRWRSRTPGRVDTCRCRRCRRATCRES